MKIAIYSPYLDTFGGGERYMMTIAETFHKDRVDVLLDNHLESIGAEYLKKELSRRFNINLEKVRFMKAPIGEGSIFFSRLFFLKNYDLLFYLTDGSIFLPSAKRNILHIQSPLVGQPAKSIWGKVKLRGWNLIIYNSLFTKKHSQNYWPIASKVIYPPADTDKIKPLQKKKFILSVGRFFGYLRSKKHQVLINTFRKLCKDVSLKDWSLHLVGSAQEDDKSYISLLKKTAGNFPISFYPNLEYGKLVKLYGESSIYWHAAGYGEKDPIKMEHFGISTVEAMAAGCVPVVINKGGQMEIVENGKNGFLWNQLEELEERTILLVKNGQLWSQLSKNAHLASQKFSKIRFRNEIIKL